MSLTATLTQTAATGPTTEAGKAVSSRNALSHGLTSTKLSVIPGESEEQYHLFIQNFVSRFQEICKKEPDCVDLATQLADLRWRARRVPAYEARVLDYEIHSLLTNPEHAELIEGLTRHQLEGLAYIRLIERKVLQNLYAQESRITRRADKIFQQLLDAATQPPAATQPQTQPHSLAPEMQKVKNEPKSAPAPVSTITHATPKTGRNEPCPCGSHLKFKRCCGNPATATLAAAC